jgi:HlyD family secretion protein
MEQYLMKKIQGKIWKWAVVVAPLAGLGAFLLLSGKTEEPQYRLEKITRGDVGINITATGTLHALTTVQVGSQVSGTIAKLYGDYNSVVQKGDLLAQLDPTFLQATVNEQRANVNRAQAQLHEAERTYQRISELSAKALVSQADLDAATTSVEATRAGLQQASAALERAQVNLRYATITAPISGVIISRDVDVGQTVAASLQAPTLFTIANDLRKMQVHASVDEADVGNVKVGQEVVFRVDSYPDDEFDGLVSQVRLAPVITQNVVTYTVIIDLDNSEQKLMPGMTANISIQVARSENVLRVPFQATRFTPAENRDGSGTGTDRGPRMNPGGDRRSPDRQQGERRQRGNRARVWILEQGELKPVSLVRGVQNTQFVEVVEGDLHEGQEVVIGLAVTASPAGSSNPFAPRSSGGSGRRGGF